MDDFFDILITRHAIRRFQDRQIDDGTLDRILDAGLYAPSAGNNQYSRIVVCQDRALNGRLGRLNRQLMFKGADPARVSHAVSSEQPSIQDDHSLLDAFYHAPTVLTIFTRPGRYAHDDAAMIAQNIMLAAHALGVGSCYVGRTEDVFETDLGREVRRSWGVPDDLVAACNVILGYRDGDAPHAKPRKPGRIVRV